MKNFTEWLAEREKRQDEGLASGLTSVVNRITGRTQAPGLPAAPQADPREFKAIKQAIWANPSARYNMRKAAEPYLVGQQEDPRVNMYDAAFNALIKSTTGQAKLKELAGMAAATQQSHAEIEGKFSTPRNCKK